MRKAGLYLGLLFLVVGFILAPVLAGPLTEDVSASAFYLKHAKNSILYTSLSFVASAFSFSVYIKARGRENGIKVSTRIMGCGICVLGPVYALCANYKHSANILIAIYDTWGPDFFSSSSMMPEWIEKFNKTANTYAVIAVLILLVILYGVFKIVNSLRNIR